MAYLAPIHRPSSVRLTLRLNLLDPSEECLVLASTNEGLVMAHSKAIYGRISMLQKISPAGSKTDHLFVGTVRAQYFTVMWNRRTQQLDTMQSFVDVSEKNMRESVSRDRCLVDPAGRILVMELYEGVLNLVKIVKPTRGKTDYLDKPEQVRITEMKVRASTFLHGESKQPKLALLYEDSRGNVRLATYRVLDDKGQPSAFDPKKDRENDLDDLCYGAMHIIPVPKAEDEGSKRYIIRNAATAKANLGGLIIVGETKLTYLDDESKATVLYALDEATIWATWEAIDETHYLLADDYGYLYILTILVDGATVTGMEVRKIGQASKSTSLENLGDGVFYIASHEADNQVIRIEGGESVTVLQTLPNVAPILDFTVMDMGGRDGETQSNEYSSGQARLVTGSGGFEGGSLRSVRSGVGLDDIGILAEMEGIRKVFALHTGPSLPNDTLVVSFATETRFFKLDSQGDFEEVETIRGLFSNAETFLTYNLDNGLILQVTAESVTLHGQNSMVHRWQPPEGHIITAASGNQKYVLVASNGRTLVSLGLEQNLDEIAVQDLGDDQVACIHVPQVLGNIGIVGLWKSGSISILDLENLNNITSEELRRTDSASIPRDIALTQILPEELSGPTLFVSMEDGIVLSFSVDKNDYSLSGRKSIVLGIQQAQLQILPRKNGLYNVFATCEHPSLIYGSEGRIVYSAVTAEDAVCVCSLDSEAYPDSIVVATQNELKLSAIDNERRTHVRTLPLGQTVRRIAYSAKERAFGIGSIKRELTKGEEIISTSFRLVDEVIFGELGKPYNFPDNNEIIESVIRAELAITYGDSQPVERFLVGTSFLDRDDADASDVRGRLLVFGVDQNRSPYLITSHVLKGACRCIGVLDGKIVAALNKTVVMYKYEEISSNSATLTKLATYRCSTCPIDIDITENIIAVADIMKSVALVEYTPGADGLPDKLDEVGRHNQQVFATSVTNVDENTYLESDHDGNLLVLRWNKEGVMKEDRKRLEVTSELNLGEMVNRVQRITVDTSSSALVVPRAFIGTTEGAIYLFSLIPPQNQDLLMRLQTRLASLSSPSSSSPTNTPSSSSTPSSLPNPNLHPTNLTSSSSSISFTPGNLDFNTYRSYTSAVRETNEPFRFVDGELIERFLDLDEEVQERVAQGLGPSVEDLRGVVEELKRLH
ncbi:dna damage-binding 1 protein [Rutstroemia sp. NJR-2017a BBW]|nr:dna damage-binding 1 protein [Rutstroemia sp. NJR-2017a BBW]